jgi:hypothetical protein
MRIALRLVLYPMALGLIALAWQHYHGSSAPADPIHADGWAGLTDQGETVRAVSSHGVLEILDTGVMERCTDGSVFTRLVRLRGRQDGRGRRLVRVSATTGAHPHGTIVAQETRGARRCYSGPVGFTLHRSL